MRRREFLWSACALAFPTRAANATLGTIAYLQADGLWVRSLPDGRPRKVIERSVKSPRFSPSGTWISFEGGVVRLDATAAAPLPAGASVWLPQQDRLAIETPNGLAFFSSINGWSAPAATREHVRLPVFNADGSEFVYSNAVVRGTGPGGEPLREGQLCRATLRSAASQILVSEYLVQPIPYRWTRDSRFILYWKDPDFSASLMADGLALFRVPATAGGPTEPLGVGGLVHDDLLALSPTENKLAVTLGGGRETYETKRIAILELDSLGLSYLTAGDSTAMSPSWSPDGRRIAYVQAPAAPDIANNLTARPYMARRRIWIADASGASPPGPITSDDRYRDEEPLWSADGTHILFCRFDNTASGTLWLMGARGENPIQVSGALPLKDFSGLSGYGFYGYIDWRGTFDWRR